ncbi:MAG: hypothetical protein OEZ02_01210 [Anaerolineae bacterium]|nr:hypothetical protein [Anaerolineae bacterium]
MIRRKKLQTLLISLVILVSAAACTLPGAKSDPPSDNQQEADTRKNGQPFDEISAKEFFQMCELAGGQIEQWGDGWACDFDSEEDITCNAGGDCAFGTVDKIGAPGYTLKSPAVDEADDPGNFVAACVDSGGAFFRWHAGFGCDFEETIDVFCGPEGGECGLGWVVELSALAPAKEVASSTDATTRDTVLVAPILQPAFRADTATGDQAAGESVMAKEVFLGEFQQGRPQTDSDTNENATARESDTGDINSDNSANYDACETAGGSATLVIVDPNDPSGKYDYVICEFPDGSGYICGYLGCVSFIDELPEGSLDIGNFEEAFLATEVYFVLAGPSDIDPGFLGPGEDWNSLYTEIVSMNGLLALKNLPGTVTIIAPNNVVFPNNGVEELLLIPNQSGDPLIQKECGILLPPLCFPDVGLLIPAGEMVYYVELAELPIPIRFNWVGKLEGDPTALPSESAGESVSVTGEDNANCRSGPGAEYSIDGLLAAGENASVLGQNAEGTWAFVQLENGRECWVWQGALTEDSDFGGAEVFPDPPTPVVPTATPVGTSPKATQASGAQNGSITGTVFKDGNGDGAMNGTDPGYGGVTVRLGAGGCSSSGLDSVVTSGNGSFSFNNLAAGKYCVSVQMTVSCGAYSVATTSTEYTISLASGGTSSKMFGFQKKVCKQPQINNPYRIPFS